MEADDEGPEFRRVQVLDLVEEEDDAATTARRRFAARAVGLRSSITLRQWRATSAGSDVEGSHSLKTGIQSRSTAKSSKVLSRTVLPTPRRPFTIMLWPAAPWARRSRSTTKASISSSRPVSAGGFVPAP